MTKLERVELLKDLIQQAVDRGATSVEQVHQTIAALPFDALERLGVLEDKSRTLRDAHGRTIGMVYNAIRTINREIGELLSDQFELLEDGHYIRKVLNRKDRKASSDAGNDHPQDTES